MHQILQQLTHIPGVVGALVAGPRGELLASAFPPLFDELALHQVAGLFSDDTAGLRKLAGPDGSLDVRYARGRAMAKPFTGGTVLVIATVTVDAQLLGLSLEQAARRLDGAARPAPGAGVGGAQRAAPGSPPPDREVTPSYGRHCQGGNPAMHGLEPMSWQRSMLTGQTAASKGCR